MKGGKGSWEDEGAGRADSEASEVTWEGMIRSISVALFTENGHRFRFLFERRGIIVDDVHGIECPMIYEEPRICKRIFYIINDVVETTLGSDWLTSRDNPAL